MKLTYDAIVDLSRWHFIQFPDQETAEEAVRKYRAYQERTGDTEGQPPPNPPPPPTAQPPTAN